MTPGPVYKYVEKWNSLYLCCQYPWCVLAVRRLNISQIARWRLPRLTVHCSVIVSGPQLGRTVWSWCGKEKGRLANRNIKCECVHVGTNPNGGCQQFHNRLTPIYCHPEGIPQTDLKPNCISPPNISAVVMHCACIINCWIFMDLQDLFATISTKWHCELLQLVYSYCQR